MEERITGLESRIAFQSQTIQELDEVVRVFADKVERLERRLAELAREVREGPPEIGPQNEVPPHY